MISLEAKIGSFLSHARKIQSNSADQCSSRQNKNENLQVFGFCIIILVCMPSSM